MGRLLPYETILKAREGDPEAVNAVLLHYAGYIRYFSKVNGQVNAEVEDYVKQRLIDCQFKFRLDGTTGQVIKLNTSRHRRGQRKAVSLEKDLLLFFVVRLRSRPFCPLPVVVVSEEGIFLPWCLAFGAFTRSRGQRERISPTPGRNHCVRCHFSESGQECPLQD